MSRDCARAVELARLRRCGDGGPAMVDGGQHTVVAARGLLVLRLLRGGGNVALVLGGPFRSCRPGIDSAGAAVKANAADVGVVDHSLVDVCVVNDGCIHMGYGSVVVKAPTAPFAADEADAAVAEAVVNAAVEAHVRAH